MRSIGEHGGSSCSRLPHHRAHLLRRGHLGTGLPESVLAAACAAAGKTVLHVDPNPFYGSLYSSVPLPSLPSFLSPEPSPVPLPPSGDDSRTVVDLHHRNIFSEVEISGAAPEPSARIAVDLVGPRVLYCRDEAVDLLLRGVLYAIAMADYDQDTDCSEKLLIAREGIQTIALYSSSIGRFANAQGAFMYPMYGHGELPQAFCRCAAVKGALYVLRMPVSALLMDEQCYICFDMTPSLHLALEEQQIAAIRVLQLSSNLAVCPPGMFMVYLSTPCADTSTGTQCIKKAIDALFAPQASDPLEGHLEETSENNEDLKPTVIWSCVYAQEIMEGTSSSLLSCPTPDEHLDYRSILDSSKKVLHCILHLIGMYLHQKYYLQTFFLVVTR
ncbi:hypothetical protein HU200_034392 [Digitaria exilis]|uniref:RAE1/2 domain-containing protein n=1 Tax=Digitaria exilis TaxID=1010633 RepID=A0A835EQL3_9POAL|nr:hypothetical protein HU200_034392 [Digitaria exilis]